MRHPVDTKPLHALIAVINDEWTDGLVQNSVVMSNSRVGKDDARKLVEALGPEHPMYAIAQSAFACFQEILKAEEAEDLRQKGISGLWDKRKPDLITVLKFYDEAHRAGKEQPTP